MHGPAKIYGAWRRSTDKHFNGMDSGAAWQSKSMALEDLQDRLREMSGLARRSGSLILYVNMVGMVNPEGRPCLVPPSATCWSQASG